MSEIVLRDDQLAVLAKLIAAELMAGQQAQQQASLLTVAQLAHHLRVSEAFVRAHADELGGIRVGGGSKPRLRFPPDAVMPAVSQVETVGQPKRQRARRANKPGTVLSIRGRSL